MPVGSVSTGQMEPSCCAFVLPSLCTWLQLPWEVQSPHFSLGLVWRLSLALFHLQQAGRDGIAPVSLSQGGGGAARSAHWQLQLEVADPYILCCGSSFLPCPALRTACLAPVLAWHWAESLQPQTEQLEFNHSS